MELALSSDFKPQELRGINLCHLFFNALALSDITNASGICYPSTYLMTPSFSAKATQKDLVLNNPHLPNEPGPPGENVST
jgi:hypothetical protein